MHVAYKLVLHCLAHLRGSLSFQIIDAALEQAAVLRKGSVAERSKALVLGTSLFGGVGSNPTAAK